MEYDSKQQIVETIIIDDLEIGEENECIYISSDEELYKDSKIIPLHIIHDEVTIKEITKVKRWRKKYSKEMCEKRKKKRSNKKKRKRNNKFIRKIIVDKQLISTKQFQLVGKHSFKTEIKSESSEKSKDRKFDLSSFKTEQTGKSAIKILTPAEINKFADNRMQSKPSNLNKIKIEKIKHEV